MRGERKRSRLRSLSSRAPVVSLTHPSALAPSPTPLCEREESVDDKGLMMV
ncbi:Leucine--tRNA ligase [Gossypium arboreum]|uniref:Leucine--tRNA ligase n=1 Tax=Gossypium arboreum TaxID=29729 RepID=A0A0B0PFN4_GOSAR|nr:Leucine--tRNA ligase [Gossypium arboreum]